MKKYVSRTIAVLLLVALLCGLSACGEPEPLPGVYKGETGADLTLYENGTVVYRTFIMDRYGEWYVEDGTLYIEMYEVLSPTLIADVSQFRGEFTLYPEDEPDDTEVFSKTADVTSAS